MMIRTPLAVLLLSLLSAAPCLAQPTTAPATQPAEAAPGFALTIYSTAEPAFDWEDWRNRGGFGGGNRQLPGYGVVRETRRITLDEGRNTYRYTGVAAGIDPTTLRFRDFRDAGASVLEQSYEYDLLGTTKLLEKYVGKTIRLDGKPVTLLSVDGGSLIYREGEDGPVRFHTINGPNYFRGTGPTGLSAIELPDTAGLILRPTLVWDVRTDVAGERPVQVTYETSGLTWRADYTVVTNTDDSAVDVGAWVTLINQSGLSYPDTRLKLVAGDVQRINPPQRGGFGGGGGGFGGGGGGQPQFEEKSFFEYHLYTLQRPTSLKDNSTKQIELFPTVENVPAEKVYVYYGLPADVRYSVFPSPRTDRDLGLATNKKVDIYLRFKNAEAEGLGIPLPAGKLRVYKRDLADDTLEFVGEDVLQHTPREETVLVRLGSAFDLVGERRQVDFRRGGSGFADGWMEEDIEIKLRNRKREPVEILVKENLYRWVNWEIIEASHEFEKQDARTIHFPIEVGPDEEATVTYTVRYTWSVEE